MNTLVYKNCYNVLGRIPNKTSSYISAYIKGYHESMKDLLKEVEVDSRISHPKALFDNSGQQYIGWLIFTKEKTERTGKTFNLDYYGEIEEIDTPKGIPSFENYYSHGSRKNDTWPKARMTGSTWY